MKTIIQPLITLVLLVSASSLSYSQIPKSIKFNLPTVLNKAEALFVGYFDDPKTYQLLEEISVLKKKIFVITSEEYAPPLQSFITSRKLDQISLLSLPENHSTAWARDYMLFVHQDKNHKSYLWDMPYGRSGDDIPQLLEKLKVAPRFVPQNYNRYTDKDINSTEYGGNILPLPYNLTVIGSNMSAEGKSALQNHLTSQFVEIDVDWLETGHVDEVLSILPTNKKGCDSFVLLEASPSLAIMLAWIERPQHHPNSFYQCFSQTKVKKKDKTFCNLFFALNLEYQSRITIAMEKIDNTLKRISGCTQIKWIRFPVLFAPVVLTDSSSKSSGATSISSNPINLISIDNTAIIGKQDFSPYKEEIIHALSSYNINPLFVEASHLNEYHGGIHCNINVKRGAKK